MKHLKFIALFVSIALLFNCCDETNDFTIIGNWKAKLSVQNDYYDGVLTSSENYTPSAKTFYKDGTGLMSNDNGYSQPFTWLLEKDKLTISYVIDYGNPINNTWEITNTTSDSFEMKLTVQQISIDPIEGTETEYTGVNIEKYYK